jgi:Arc/MetJ-type ribon-helix-helix transcriptional regulator
MLLLNLLWSTPMDKKIIQVPMDEDLLAELDTLTKQTRQSRAEVIREACRRYLAHLENARLDRAYQEGYRRHPEKPGLARAQAALAGSVLPKESW